VLLAYLALFVIADMKTGEVTFYNPADVMDKTSIGACGNPIHGDQNLAALSHLFFDTYPGATANPNKNPLCGKQIKVTYQGHEVTATIADRCSDCEGEFNVDLTPVAFNVLGDPNTGRLFGATWDFVDDSGESSNGTTGEPTGAIPLPTNDPATWAPSQTSGSLPFETQHMGGGDDGAGDGPTTNHNFRSCKRMIRRRRQNQPRSRMVKKSKGSSYN